LGTHTRRLRFLASQAPRNDTVADIITSMPDAAYPPIATFIKLPAIPDVTVDVPGSKSITTRALLIAALADGVSLLRGALDADDTRRMIECLGALGIAITQTECGLTVRGAAGRFSAPAQTLFVGNSGTTIRFLTAASPLAPEGSVVMLDGIERMRQRPIQDLVDAMTQLGTDVRCLGKDGCPPVSVAGGGLKGGACRVRGNLSSQYLSGLLMASAMAETDTFILVDGDLVSKPYVDLTASVMASFGVSIDVADYKALHIPCGRVYSPQAYDIEPDASNASYFLAAAALTGGRVRVRGIGSNSLQGDAAFASLLEAMGCKVEQSADSTTVTGLTHLWAIDYNMDAMPDMAQTAGVLALFATGTTRLTGLSTLRVKETDRIAAMATELTKMGADVQTTESSMTITPPKIPQPAQIDTYDDHRMAMSFAVAGLRVPMLSIVAPGCVAKTFPDFWRCWQQAFGNQSAARFVNNFLPEWPC